MEEIVMERHVITRRSVLAGLAAASALRALPAAAQANAFGPPELIEAAKKEGRLVFYTANFIEVEQEVINAFNKRFPFVRVEMVRAPGGQLITRVKTEASAGKLLADIVDHSDLGLMLELQELFQDYGPPNPADYLPDSRGSAFSSRRKASPSCLMRRASPNRRRTPTRQSSSSTGAFRPRARAS